MGLGLEGREHDSNYTAAHVIPKEYGYATKAGYEARDEGKQRT